MTRILGIETSCDETAVALVEGELDSKRPLKIVSSVLASSAEMQSKYGGILPEQAARQQTKAMIPTLKECFERAILEPGLSDLKIGLEDVLSKGAGVDAIAITTGPGLIGSLLVGVETARTLAYLWRKPIIPVNHLVAHLYANWVEVSQAESETPLFPAIGLVVSGGHTDMVLLKNHKSMNLVGSTRDDAAGECFDKCARMLGLPYPGGPEIARLAEGYSKSQSLSRIKLDLFPRPLVDQGNFDWSFSGLKTSVLYHLEKLAGGKIGDLKRFGAKKVGQKKLEELAAEIQEAICDSLVIKLGRAVDTYKPKSVLVAGGVAANKRLKEKMEAILANKARLFVPPAKLCTDNGAYIAAYAFYHFYPSPWEKIDTNPSLTIMGE